MRCREKSPMSVLPCRLNTGCVLACLLSSLLAAAGFAETPAPDAKALSVLPPATALQAGALRDRGFRHAWQIRLPLEGAQTITHVHQLDDQLYACISDGYVFAVDVDSGAVRWSRPVAKFGEVIPKPVHHGENVIFATRRGLRVYDRTLGDLRKEVGHQGGARHIAVSGDTLFVGDDRARVAALDANTFHRNWHSRVEGLLAHPPTIEEPNTFAITDQNKIYASTTSRPRSIWPRYVELREPASTPLVSTEAGLLLGGRDGIVRLIDRNSGRLLWEVQLSAVVEPSLVVLDDIAYATTLADGLVAISLAPDLAAQERILWKISDAEMLISASKDALIVRLWGGEVLFRDRATGRSLGTVDFWQYDSGVQHFSKPRIILADRFGRMLVAKPSSETPFTDADVAAALLRPALRQQIAELAAASAELQSASSTSDVDRAQPERQERLLGATSEISRRWGTDQPDDDAR